jgi:hypothetical protein
MVENHAQLSISGAQMEACYDCAFKHLSMAYEVWFEIEGGYQNAEHYMKMVGNLAQAESHLLVSQPELAADIREHRKKWFDARVLGVRYVVPFTELATSLWAAILVEAHKDGEEESGNE